uniref:Uncharacterized protein n=1 Tax=Salix viminalis TaxID=40686 RepID=A0A6N2LJE6_SALVM
MVSRVITIVPSVPSAYCGAFDIAYMAPSDEAELMHNVATAAAIDDTEPAASGSHGQWDRNISISEQQSNRTGGTRRQEWNTKARMDRVQEIRRKRHRIEILSEHVESQNRVSLKELALGFNVEFHFVL